MRRMALWTMAFLLASGAAGSAGEGFRPDPQRYEKTIQKFEGQDKKNPRAPGQVLFVGSSSFTLWHSLERDFAPLAVINRGFGGSTANDAFHFAPRVIVPYAPDILVLYEGNNDLAFGLSPQGVIEDFQKLLALVHEKLPTTEVLILSSRPCLARKSMRPELNRMNRMLLGLAEADPRVGYVDMNPVLLDETGEARVDLLVEDLLHLNAQGNQAWLPLIRAAIESCLAGEAPEPRGLERLRAALLFEERVYRGKPCQLTVPVKNPGAEAVTLRAAWQQLEGCRAEPAVVDALVVPAGGEASIAFMLTLPPGQEQTPYLRWTATAGGKTLAWSAGILALDRGIYLTGAGEVPASGRLLADQARQVYPFGGSTWGGAEDLSASAVVRVLPEALVVRVEVQDQTVVGQGSKHPWEVDAVEFHMDTRPAGAGRALNRRGPGWFQVIAVPRTGGGLDDTLHFFADPKLEPVAGAALQSGLRAGGYWIEAAIPWNGLARAGVEKPAGTPFFFTFMVDDVDEPGKLKQQIRWNGRDADHQRPGLWGLLEAAE